MLDLRQEPRASHTHQLPGGDRRLGHLRQSRPRGPKKGCQFTREEPPGPGQGQSCDAGSRSGVWGWVLYAGPGCTARGTAAPVLCVWLHFSRLVPQKAEISKCPKSPGSHQQVFLSAFPTVAAGDPGQGLGTLAESVRG